MAHLDRADLVALLGRLGSENQETVRDAARELHRKVRESGLTWDDLVRPELTLAGGPHDAAPLDGAPAGAGGEMQMLGRLLARTDISDNLRQELTEMKRSLADGSLDEMDSRYVQALAARLGL